MCIAGIELLPLCVLPFVFSKVVVPPVYRLWKQLLVPLLCFGAITLLLA